MHLVLLYLSKIKLNSNEFCRYSHVNIQVQVIKVEQLMVFSYVDGLISTCLPYQVNQMF